MHDNDLSTEDESSFYKSNIDYVHNCQNWHNITRFEAVMTKEMGFGIHLAKIAKNRYF